MRKNAVTKFLLMNSYSNYTNQRPSLLINGQYANEMQMKGRTVKHKNSVSWNEN